MVDRMLFFRSERDAIRIRRRWTEGELGRLQSSAGKPGTAIVPMRESDGYKADWIGLKTLDAAKKIDFLSFEGEHIRFSQDFWEHQVLPYFNA